MADLAIFYVPANLDNFEPAKVSQCLVHPVLRAAGIEVLHDLPGVGENLQDRPSVIRAGFAGLARGSLFW